MAALLEFQRARWLSDAFRADMNDPTKSGAEAVADALKSQ